MVRQLCVAGLFALFSVSSALKALEPADAELAGLGLFASVFEHESENRRGSTTLKSLRDAQQAPAKCSAEIVKNIQVTGRPLSTHPGVRDSDKCCAMCTSVPGCMAFSLKGSTCSTYRGRWHA
jgi:hypothetical protein